VPSVLQHWQRNGVELKACSPNDGVTTPAAEHGFTAEDCLCAAGGVLGRLSWLLVSDFAQQTLLGEGAGVVLEGQRVLPVRAQVG
jgi:uncharacterized protein